MNQKEHATVPVLEPLGEHEPWEIGLNRHLEAHPMIPVLGPSLEQVTPVLEPQLVHAMMLVLEPFWVHGSSEMSGNHHVQAAPLLEVHEPLEMVVDHDAESHLM